ncbi:MAG: MgtC/SapB family protein [Clostridiales bacterium]|nr:MgtC/SapB family protein [Clostridiales bacterium]
MLSGLFFETISWGDVILRIGASVIAGIVIGLERTMSNHPAGMKTHVLVCLGAALASLTASEMTYTVMEVLPGGSADLSRIAAGVVQGVGFLGAGAIMKSNDGVVVTGLTTAATLWVTACIGLSIGMGYFKMSIVSLVTVFIANTALKYLEKKVPVRSNVKTVEIATTEKRRTVEFIEGYFSSRKIDILNFDFIGDLGDEETPSQNIYYFRYTIRIPRSVHFLIVLRDLALQENISQVFEVDNGEKGRKSRKAKKEKI